MISGRLRIALPCAVGFFLASAGLTTLIDWTRRNWNDIVDGRITLSLPWRQEPVRFTTTLPGRMQLPLELPRVNLSEYEHEITLGAPDAPRVAKAKVFVFNERVGSAEDPHLLLPSVVRFWKSSATTELSGIVRKAQADAEATGKPGRPIVDVTNVFSFSRRDPQRWSDIRGNDPCAIPCALLRDVLPNRFDSYRVHQSLPYTPEDLLLILGDEVAISEGGYRTLLIKQTVHGSPYWWTMVEIPSLDPSTLTEDDLQSVRKLAADAYCSTAGVSTCVPTFSRLTPLTTAP